MSDLTAAQNYVTDYQRNNQSALPDRDVAAKVAELLQKFGLTGLDDWALGQLRQGATAAQLYMEIQKTPQFEARFPAIKRMREMGASHIPTPEEYIAMEDHYTEVAHNAGIMPGIMTRETMAKLIAGGVSPVEFDKRVEDGYARVQNASPQVRDAFAQYFGVKGDQALLNYFLEPDASRPLLVEQATAATLGAQGQAVLGSWFGADRMVQLAQAGFDTSSAQARFDKLASLAGVFDETLGERADLTAEREGISSAFDVNQTPAERPDVWTTLPAPKPTTPEDDGGSSQDATKKIEGRLRDRSAAFTGSTRTYRGRQGETSGLGVADR